MNILLISPNSPFASIGGVERYLTNFITYCQDQPSFKTIVVLPSYNDEDKTLRQGSVTIYFSKHLANRGHDTTKVSALKFAKEVDELLEKHNIGVVCAENFHLGLPPAFSLHIHMVAGLRNIPVVLRVHSFASSELQTELINQLMWRRISCVSKSVAGDCFHKGADIATIATDYLGVATDEFRPNPAAAQALRHKLGLKPEHTILLTASRIILGRKDILKQKGIINTIKAFSKLSPHRPELRLVIAVGQAPNNLKSEFEKAYNMLLGYLQLHDVADKTIVKKFKLNEMPSVYQIADIFMLPSENETFGQVFIEAMASGTPVIGTKVGGIPEIISDGRNGYLVSPNDVTMLCQRIETLTGDKATREKMTLHAHKVIAQKFDATQQFAHFIDTLQGIAQKAKKDSVRRTAA